VETSWWTLCWMMLLVQCATRAVCNAATPLVRLVLLLSTPLVLVMSLGRYDSLYDFDDYDMMQLDKMVEIMNEEPTIGIRGGDIPRAEDFDATVEFKDVAFNRPAWCVRARVCVWSVCVHCACVRMCACACRVRSISAALGLSSRSSASPFGHAGKHILRHRCSSQAHPSEGLDIYCESWHLCRPLRQGWYGLQ
jgi:hypothetical protein